MPQHRVGSGGEHSVASSMQAQSSGGEHPAAPLGLEWPPLPQTTASMPRSGGSHPVTSLPQALARLRGDDSEEARRIREAETLVKTGNKSEIRALCTPDAGWGVSLRVSGQEKPQAELKKELRDQFLAAARRHLAVPQLASASSSSGKQASVGLHHIGDKERGEEGTPERKEASDGIHLIGGKGSTGSSVPAPSAWTGSSVPAPSAWTGSSVPAPRHGQAQDSLPEAHGQAHGSLPQAHGQAQESLPEALAQASPPATLEEALDRLRGDDAEEAVRIRQAAVVARDGKQTQLRTLCARGGGWDQRQCSGQSSRAKFWLRHGVTCPVYRQRPPAALRRRLQWQQLLAPLCSQKEGALRLA